MLKLAIFWAFSLTAAAANTSSSTDCTPRAAGGLGPLPRQLSDIEGVVNRVNKKPVPNVGGKRPPAKKPPVKRPPVSAKKKPNPLVLANQSFSGISVPGMNCVLQDSGATRCRGLLPGTPYVTNIFFPAGFKKTDSLDASVFFHGIEHSAEAQGVFNYFNFGNYANQSGNRNRVIIVPEQQTTQANINSHFGEVVSGSGFQNWMDKITGAMASGGLLKNHAVGKLSLTGHSRAYTTLAMLAGEKSAALDKVHSVATFDCYNSFNWQGKKPPIEASIRLQGFVDRVQLNGGYFYANSVPGSESSMAFGLYRQRVGGANATDLSADDAARFRQGAPLPSDKTRFLFQNAGSSHYTQVSDYYTSFLKTIP